MRWISTWFIPHAFNSWEYMPDKVILRLILENLSEREKHLILYLQFVCLMNYQVCGLPDKLRLAAAIFLAGKIMHSSNSDATVIGSEFCLNPDHIKATAMEIFVFVGAEDSEERLTAVKRLFNHSQFGYISTLKLALKST